MTAAHIGPYTLFAFRLNALLEDGETASVAEVSARIMDGTLFDWLDQSFQMGTFVGPDALEPYQALELFEHLVEVGTAGAFGADANGLAMLVAFCFEAIQQRALQVHT